ncbi:MAG: hypothetical protein ABEJ68_04330 [Halobacteriaceae archaeon]
MSGFRFAARVVIAGAWCLFGGLALAVVASRVGDAATSDADAAGLSATGVNVGALVTASLAGVYEAGAFAIGFGAALVLVGGRLFFGRRPV